MIAPDVTGPAGSAWKASTALGPAGLDCWLLHRPGAHPFWCWYIVTGCSLRVIPGAAPAVKRRADVTHEIMVVALDPDYTPDDAWCANSERRWGRHLLLPVELSEQLSGITDEDLNGVLAALVRAFCSGETSPDSDCRARNRAMIESTAAELRGGKREVV